MRRSSARNFAAKWLPDERDCYSLDRFDSEVILEERSAGGHIIPCF